ncbi:MAG: hypothetical protein H6861_02250 [Rhodospirillales bacterium]|nr:hypothetical protein [Rhodospirillales bacterium]
MSFRNRAVGLSLLFGATQLAGCATSFYGDKGQELTFALGNGEGADKVIAVNHRVVRIPSNFSDQEQFNPTKKLPAGEVGATATISGGMDQPAEQGQRISVSEGACVVCATAIVSPEEVSNDISLTSPEGQQTQGIGGEFSTATQNVVVANGDADSSFSTVNSPAYMNIVSGEGKLACQETLLTFNEITNTLSKETRLTDDTVCPDMKYYKNPQDYNFEFGGITGCFASAKVSPEELKASPDEHVAVAVDSVPVALCYEYAR